MLGEVHDLIHEFPDLVGKIDAMRASDTDFAEDMDRYDALDARVRRLEELGTPVADETIEDLKKERLLLKDRLYGRLRSEANAAAQS
ncbi:MULTISPECIES: YdcH family protein [Thiorhodovibrio]|uniref:YdcH family protein n=1 Tax=Thiorhodovibrio TaxID=61593 RepID=UPI0019121D3D|nr:MULTISPECIES: YdcH family protein [Thiorhodovibrio]MBK5970887.1 hypothetical protein [Thiorhodovibrio winogradskyi]WPL11381.1 hypothetical protein Thiosp_01115 [Thiorhodovibrio litoralis]